VKHRLQPWPRAGEEDIVVSQKGAESARRGHPWIFRSAVLHPTGTHGAASPGSICRIVTESREVLGCGIYDPTSPIAARIWGLGPNAKLNADTFRVRVERALAIRRTLFPDAHTTAYRILNGEGDRVPGFVLDRYGDVAVLRIDGDAARHLAPEITRHLDSLLQGEGITTLLERESARVGRTSTTQSKGIGSGRVNVRFGPERGQVHVTEHGVPFVVDVMHGQKTGAFLDQRENRKRIGELVAMRLRAGLSARVLNLFSYTGGFSLRAALAGATVTSLDIAPRAHLVAEQSFAAAGVAPQKHEFVVADAFTWLAEAKRRGQSWDVVISDPPSFAPSERTKPKAMAAYRVLHRGCANVLAQNGHLVLASCSSHITLEDFATTFDDASLGRSDLEMIETFALPADHPTLPSFPEGRYLKLVILT